MPNLIQIKKEIAKIDSAKSRLLKMCLEKARKTKICCAKCRRQSELRKWTFVQDHYYVAPYSCSGGAYWLQSETKVCNVICPKCRHRNYIYIHPQRDKLVEIEKEFSASKLFHAVTEEHEPQRF